MATDTLLDEARDLLDDAVKLRRTLHRQPEIGLELPFAQERVVEALDGLPLVVTRGRSTTSVTAMLTGSRPGPTIVLRGDMDALPMPEDTGVEFASTVKGAMHACGHDLHTSMLAGAARVLSARRGELAGRVLFMFQPGEEGQHGARFMLEDGLLDVGADSPVDKAFALHVTTMLPSGFVGLKAGPMLASADVLRITVTGRGGHASMPHTALDPIPVACAIVQAIQTMITRRVDVFDPAVVTVAQIVSGTTSNVIPETVFILGTIRAVSERTRSLVHDELRRVSEGVATAHGATAAVEIEAGYPVTINDHDVASFASGVARDLLGDDHVLTMPTPVMGAEDWSYVLQRVPGAMAFLGACTPGLDPSTAPPNHSNRVTFDETAMTTGIGLYAAVALRHLAG
ncbi:MAG: M20 family metallopeptidase [Acidimicrobiales bacterium]